MRNTALICAATVIVLGAVVGTVLVVQDGGSTSSHAASPAYRSSPAASTSASSTSPEADRFVRANSGLRRLLAANRPTTAKPVVALRSCPFAPGVPLASTGLRAAGVPSQDSHRGTIDVRDWSDSGDYGVVVTCRFTGVRAFTAAVFMHVHTVGRAPIYGFDGPLTLDGGRLYRSTDKDKCAAYWSPPPGSDYVISVQFAAPNQVDPAPCGKALQAVQPTIFDGLIKLDG